MYNIFGKKQKPRKNRHRYFPVNMATFLRAVFYLLDRRQHFFNTWKYIQR